MSQAVSPVILRTFPIICLLGLAFERCVAEDVLYEQRIQARPLPIIVPVSVEHSVVPMMLDTGCFLHAFDPSMQSHFGRFIDRARIAPLGRLREAGHYEAPDMALGVWELPPWTLFEMNCQPFETLLGSELKGCLGLGAFQNAAIDVNFDAKRLRVLRNFRAPGAATLFFPGEEDHGAMHYVPVKLSREGLPLVRVLIDGNSANLAIDTGAISSITLRSELFGKLVASGVIALSPERNDNMVESAVGTFKVQTGEFTRGEILGINLKGVPVENGNNLDLLGLLFLLNLDFVYDLPSERLYFVRRKAEPPLRPDRMIGASLIYPGGACRVYRLARGGPAEITGVRKNDTILKLGSLESMELNGVSVYDLCESRAGQTIEIEYSRDPQPQRLKGRLKLLEKQFIYPRQP